MKKKSVFLLTAVVCIAVISSLLFVNKNTNEEVNRDNNAQLETKKIKDGSKVKIIPKKSEKISDKKNIIDKDIIKEEQENNNTKFINMYSDIPASMMPLSAIAEASCLPENIRNKVFTIAENNGIYMMNKHKDKLLLVVDNPANIRHNIGFTEISLHSGIQTETSFGYNDKIKDSENEIWEYTDKTQMPERHTKYDNKGDMEFVEVWNYDETNPIKYEMKDADGRVISLRKETLQNGTELRVEHILYDKDGNTRMTISAVYDGGDIKRFTYYNSDKAYESGSIFGTYTDGLKTKESVYSSDLKLINTYSSEYKDGVRENITKWDNQNNEVEKFLPVEEAL